MPAPIRINNFKGQIPAFAARALPTNFAQTAQNVDLSSGQVQGIRNVTSHLTPITTNSKTCYNFKNVMLYWTSYVEVARAPRVLGDDRIFFTNGTAVKQLKFADAVAGTPGTEARTLGLSAPALPPQTVTKYTWAANPLWALDIDYEAGDWVQQSFSDVCWKCIKAYTGGSDVSPSFTGWDQGEIWAEIMEHWQVVEFDAGAAAYASGASYTVGTVVVSGAALPFKCKRGHRSTAEDKAGYGANWPLYWEMTPTGDLIQSVAYCYTYVTDWGEESAPSPATVVQDIYENMVVAIRIPIPGAGLPANVTHFRVYRLATGDTGTEYQLLPFYYDNRTTVQIAAGATMTLTVNDTGMSVGTVYAAGTYTFGAIVQYSGWCYRCIAVSTVNAPTNATDWQELYYMDVSVDSDGTTINIPYTINENLGEVLPSEDWDAPPATLRGIVDIGGGAFAGFVGNTVYFSEPGYPFAWPTKYTHELSYAVVAIVPFSSGAIVLTEGFPYLILGTDPATLVPEKMNYQQACIAGRAAVGFSSADVEGVLYPSTDGVCFANASGVRLISEKLFTRDQWKSAVSTSGGSFDLPMFAFFHDNEYLLFLEGVAYGIRMDFSDLSHMTSFTGPGPATGSAVAMWYGGNVDPVQDRLFLVGKDAANAWHVYLWNQVGTSRAQYTWKSKKFQTLPTNLVCAKIVGDQASGSAVTFKEYADGVLKGTFTVIDQEVFRLVPGFLARYWEFEIISSVAVDEILVGFSSTEIAE